MNKSNLFIHVCVFDVIPKRMFYSKLGMFDYSIHDTHLQT